MSVEEDQVRLVPNGQVDIYEVGKGHAHNVSATLPRDNVETFAGEKGYERMVEKTLPVANVCSSTIHRWIWSAELGCYMVRPCLPSGKVGTFDGCGARKDIEHKHALKCVAKPAAAKTVAKSAFSQNRP